jgi:hemolysin III
MVTKRLKDPVSAISHMIGAVLSVIGTAYLVYKSVAKGSTRHVVAFSIYGLSMILLYTASSVYHSIPASEEWTQILRKIDHSMISVLIAGTYTPFCLIALENAWRWSILAAIWGLAIAGIIMSIAWIDAPRWFSTLVYVLMGWLIVIASVPLTQTITQWGVIGLLVGGLSYSLGAVIYATKWPKIRSKTFGFHEIFHFFVLGGTASHYWVMVRFVLPLA